MKYIKVKKNYGGGGGTVSTIPDWAKPYLQNVGNAAEKAYGEGELGKVAGASALQQTAFGGGAEAMIKAGQGGISALESQQKRLGDLATQGAYDTKALKDAAILQAGMETAKLNQNFGGTGTLGSARQAVQQGAQNAATAAQFAKIDSEAEQRAFENKMLAEKGIGQNVTGASSLASGTTSGLAALGQQQRGIDQQGLDATYQGLQRFASTIYGNPARQQAGGK
jgi:hypothetical protein